MLRSLVVLAGVSSLLAVACDRGGGSGGGNGASGGQMAPSLGVDFANVEGFVIAPALANSTAGQSARGRFQRPDGLHLQSGGSGGGNGQSGPQVLYALNADGTMTETTVTTGTSTTASPLQIDDTPKFTFFEYEGVEYDGTPCFFVAARKSDAALFCVDVEPQGATNLIATDATGNLVFVYGTAGAEAQAGPASTNTLVQLDFTDPANPVQSVFIDGLTNGAPVYVVNAEGDVACYVPGVVTDTVALRVYKHGGGYSDIAALVIPEGCLAAGLAADPNDFYYTNADSTNGPPGASLFQITAASGFAGPGTLLYDEGSQGILGTGLIGGANGSPCSSYAVAGGSLYAAAGGGIVELVPSDGGNPSFIPVSSTFSAGLNFIYGFDGGIVGLGTATSGSTGLDVYGLSGTPTALVPTGLYDITTASVSSAGETTFGGTRASDGAQIVGTIPAGSTTVNIVTQFLSSAPTQIQRID
jgi:hypothetical protein